MPRSGLVELNAVVAVAAHRNFRSAATELGISPSALSHAVAALEARLGVRLFNRTTRSVALSDAGAQFLQRVRPALAEISDAVAAAGALQQTPSGTLRLNVAEGAGEEMLGRVAAEYLRRYPAMNLDIVAEGRMVDIVAEGFDAGFRFREAVPRDMIAVPFGPDLSYCRRRRASLLAAHGKPRAPADLLAHNCIRKRMPSGAIYRWEFERHSEHVALDVKGNLTLGSNALAIDASLRGVGLAFVAEWLVADHVAAGRLERVLIDWTPPFPGLCLYYPGHRHVPAGLRAFIDVMREMAPVTGRKKKRAGRSPPSMLGSAM